MPEAPNLLERIDRIMAELAALRAEIFATVAKNVGDDVVSHDNDLSEANLLDTHSASARFNYPPNTLAKWARTEGLGVKRGGRWLVSIPRLQRRLNGG